MPAKGRGPKGPRVPVSGGWTAAHGMGVAPEASNGNTVQSRLRPRVTKNEARASEVKSQTNTTQHKVKTEQDATETSLAPKASKQSEIYISEPLKKLGRTTRASRNIDPRVKDTTEGTEDVQINKGITTEDVVEKGPLGTKRKRQARIFMTPKGRSAYETYVKIPWRTTPYPDFHEPTPEACEKVCALLEEQHGRCPRPDDIPPPSLDVAGCGQVRQVIDAIVRTVISANTTFENADKAIKRLYETFGTVTENLQLDAEQYPGLHHCLDYNKIRLTSAEAVANAIKPAGNHFMRAKWIKGLLDGTYKINAERAEAFRNEAPDSPAIVLAADKLFDKQKQFEIWAFDKGILHLEHYRALSNKDAMDELVSWEGIAVKTAACVMLFCMQQPVFALDTHCLRLAKWLGWTPHNSGEQATFAHLDALVPDDLKYPLHQLFIRHGQVCLKCREKSNVGSAGWGECVCPLEDLLKRDRKELPPPKPKKAAKSRISDVEEEEDMNTKVVSPKESSRKLKQEIEDENYDDDSDDDYEEPPKKRGRKPKKKAAGGVPTRRQTRGRKTVGEGASQTKIEAKIELEPADIDIVEAMLNEEKNEEMVAKAEAGKESSGLSEHTESEFVE
ncbi:hypothetical protein VSDG_06060 [Cytospora chrysosperma]|uniref:HhH-GPD domain-containing protein n=1 Tax=Cytospora chrysosperma TaxID=252740 RepID=A0A423VWI5_CYTCH|nr:hypothetical protein VSDG_06060 [Valsa sordida]